MVALSSPAKAAVLASSLKSACQSSILAEIAFLPVRGYGLWSTLHGFIALKNDFKTVVGLGFYQHAETPGLGGEVDNPHTAHEHV